MAVAIKNRSRSEIIEAFRESIRKKNECMTRLSEIIKDIRKEEQGGLALGFTIEKRSDLDIAIAEAEAGKVTKCSSLDELINAVG